MLVQRMLRAAKLEVSLFEEVEADTAATTQALTVVIIVALASGIGSAIGAAQHGNFLLGLVGGILTAILGWLAWAFIAYFIGTRVMEGTATWGELLRTIGFAQSPGILLVFSFIPCVGVLLAIGVGIWMLVAGVVAVRQALDITTGKAVVTMVIGFIVYMVLAVLIALVFGGFGALAGAT